MTVSSPESVLSVLLKAGSPSGNAQSLVDAMMSIQTQLSVIQENQRIIMKTLREIKIEQSTRLGNLKKSTQGLIKAHHAINDRLDEIRDSVQDQNDGDDGDAYDLDDLFK